MRKLLLAIRKSPLLLLLVAVPVVLVLARVTPDAHRALFLLSVAAIIPLATLMSHATESVAARTGDLVGGLLNATLGNLTELVIALAALRAGMYDLVKASMAGAMVTNLLFMLGCSFLLGGLRHHVQEFNRPTARLQSGMMLLATIALIVPSALGGVQDIPPGYFEDLSTGLSILLIVTYGLSLFFSLGTHRREFAPEGEGGHDGGHEGAWPLGVAIGALVAITIAVALVAEVFVESAQSAAESFGMSQAFVGFIVVSLVGGAAEMASAFGAARKNRLDLSVGIAMGSSAQIALFVAPVLVLLSHAIAPEAMDLRFAPGLVIMVLLATVAASMTTNGGRAAWYSGVQLIAVYGVFAVTLYLLP